MSSSMPSRVRDGDARKPCARVIAAESAVATSCGEMAGEASADTGGAAGQKAPLRRPIRVVRGRAGDHLLIHQLLMTVFHGPSVDEFLALQDEPLYEPVDRLVVKDAQRILSHVHLTSRLLHFGSLTLPVVELLHLATAPEFRSRGMAKAVLAAAERQMVDRSAVVGTLRTTIPGFFYERGWGICGRHCYSAASARDILAFLRPETPSPPVPWRRPPAPLNIRLWRHVEQDALSHLYQMGTTGAYGPLFRSEPYWRWLISRRAYDRIYVAIDGPDDFELDQCVSRIVGYAVMKADRILEVMTAPTHPGARAQLLVRACADAIEHDHHVVRLDSPRDDPLHEIIRRAGGTHHHGEADGGEVFMAKLVDPVRFLSNLCPALGRRASLARLRRPCELGLSLYGGRDKYRLIVSDSGVQLDEGKLPRSFLVCDAPELAQMLLGHLDVHRAVAAGRMEASTAVAVETASILFPQLPCWRPPLDDLPAQ